MIRDKTGLIVVSTFNNRLIWDMEHVLKGIPIKRAILIDDPNSPGAKDRKTIAKKVTDYRELIGRPEPVTTDQVKAALYLLRAINKEKDIDQRYGFYIPYGDDGPNATGFPRFYVLYYGEEINIGDPRIPTFRAGDLAIKNSSLSKQKLLCEVCSTMRENATDARQKALWTKKLGQELQTYGEMQLANMGY